MYQVTMEPTRQHWVVALELPYDWSLDKTFMGQQQQLARAQPIDQRIVYNVASHTDFRVDQDLNRFSRDYHLRLPDDTNPRTVDFRNNFV